jgi:aminoglycoside phosphotransferase (APT) family kinase protein
MSDVIATRAGEGLNADILNKWLSENAPRVGQIVRIHQFPGGFSNLTYLLETDRGTFVLRRPPVGANIKSAHDMDREYRVLSLLRPVYDRVPAPLAFCADEAVIGAPFYIMEYLQGVVLRPGQVAENTLTEAQWRQMGKALIDNLATLHSLEMEKSGLISLGKPEGYVERQVEGWVKRYFAAQTDDIASMQNLSEWLPKNLPVSPAPAFLHNDYKFDNVLFTAHDTPVVSGVLDWEMATVGDPLMDLGAALAWWVEAGDGTAMRRFNVTWMPGNLTRTEAAGRYAEKSGRDLRALLFYYVFGLFKNAVIGQQIYARWKKGLTADARFGQLLPMIQGLAHKGVVSIESGKMA